MFRYKNDRHHSVGLLAVQAVQPLEYKEALLSMRADTKP